MAALRSFSSLEQHTRNRTTWLNTADVAKDGYEAMMRGEGDIVSGWSNKLMTAATSITPAAMLGEAHGKLAKPGSGRD
jgi:short-subunit dehydrogenase